MLTSDQAAGNQSAGCLDEIVGVTPVRQFGHSRSGIEAKVSSLLPSNRLHCFRNIVFLCNLEGQRAWILRKRA